MPDEQIPVQGESMAAYFECVFKARAAIVAKEGRARGVRGEITCPVDGGRIAYTIAHNGHIHAACSNQGCVRWME
jgi:hypothetical protein